MKISKGKKKNKAIFVFIAISLLTISTTGCKKVEQQNYDTIVNEAKKEGKVVSLAMPDEWANWGESWKDISIFYNISHSDTDMNSAEELENFKKGIGDIGDVGYNYGRLAEKENLTYPYETSYWNEIPDWAKDDNGDWIVAYTGTLAFMVKGGDRNVSIGWKDLETGNFTVGTSDVCTSSQAQYSVYAAALALGGNINNIQPGIDLFKKLAQEGKLTDQLHDETTSIESNIDVNIKWDFNALGYRDAGKKINKEYGVCIPNDGSVTIGYASVINKRAENINSAMLTREYIFSDAGQLNLASGYATPIRAIVLPKELEDRRIDRSQYTDKMIQAGLEFNDSVGNNIAQAWEEQVLPILNERGRAK